MTVAPQTYGAYARPVEFLIWLVIIAVVVGGGVWAWTHRAWIIAKMLGQPEDRIKRAIERRKS